MIDPPLADFLEQGLAIHLGTRNDRLEPNGARVTAARVEDDGLSVVAYVPALSAGRVLPDLEANGQVALCFCRPTDDRGCQVKGTFVEAVPAEDRDRAFVLDQWDRFLSQLDAIGIPRVAMESWSVWPCVAVRLRVTALFNQTPGPGAGAPLA